MDERQKELIQESWDKLRPDVERAAELFYTRLFEEDPSLRRLFKGDMAEQGRQFMNMLGTAVDKLDELENFAPMLQQLGRRHTGYGVEPQHYETFHDALIWTLHNTLGADFYPDVEHAWEAFFSFLSQSMKEGTQRII